ncbi:MAG: WG repeat-containing protein [Bacteroidales bacterium]|nr:WG repeat-containing protein [Bacteroidales bacterium]
MKTIKLICAIAAWTVIGSATVIPFVSGCTSCNKPEIVEAISDEGMLLNDDLVVYRSEDGKVSIKNAATGVVTIKDIRIDWTLRSRNDSLAVFCSDNKRGYYNMYTGEIAVPAQYRRAWIFSEGLAAVQRNGNIGFIDHQGKVVIDFLFPYHGNPLTEFVFDDGHCVVANADGKCGVIDKAGKWLIQPEYDTVNAFSEYAIVSKSGVSKQLDYDGKVLNSFVLDSVYELTYKEEERFENREGEIEYVDRTVKTGLFSYSVGGRYGLMDGNCHRLTEPLYSSIRAVNGNMFRAILLDGWSEVILNAKGEVMK